MEKKHISTTTGLFDYGTAYDVYINLLFANVANGDSGYYL